MIVESTFKPAWWLTNAHAQTVYSTLTRYDKAPIDRTERVELPDGDFVDLAWAENGLNQDSPLIIFLHGLGGSVRSTYVAGQLRAYNNQGWRGVLMHFRGASEEPNRFQRAYHSGDTADLDYVLRLLSKREPNTKKAVVGISLGGNVLLKWLGEQGAQSLVETAVAVSVPFQLKAISDRMNHGFARIYQSHLLGKMRALFQRKIDKYPEFAAELKQQLDSASCFWTFDDRITAPLHGFSYAHHYYRESSSRQFLGSIETPTLIIHALDDPFMTPEVVPHSHELSKQITLELSTKGGHVGFITGNIPGNAIYWLDQRIPEYLRTILL